MKTTNGAADEFPKLIGKDTHPRGYTLYRYIDAHGRQFISRFPPAK